MASATALCLTGDEVYCTSDALLSGHGARAGTMAVNRVRTVQISGQPSSCRRLRGPLGTIVMIDKARRG